MTTPNVIAQIVSSIQLLPIIQKSRSAYKTSQSIYFYSISLHLAVAVMKKNAKLLVRFINAENMDFCGDLANIQSILNYENDSIRPLARIQYRGGK